MKKSDISIEKLSKDFREAIKKYKEAMIPVFQGTVSIKEVPERASAIEIGRKLIEKSEIKMYAILRKSLPFRKLPASWIGTLKELNLDIYTSALSLIFEIDDNAPEKLKKMNGKKQ